MKYTTHDSVRVRIARALVGGAVIHHEPTEQNKIGQSGMHTVADDLIDLVLGAANEADAYRRVIEFLAAEG